MGSSHPRQLLLITCLIITFIYLCTANSGRNHGKSCSKRKECNSAAGLSCLKNICQCSNPEAQIYSETIKACVVKVGRRCGGDDDEDDNVNNTTARPVTICSENAECKKLKIRKWCRCKEGYMSNAEGTFCSPASRYGESCNQVTEPCEKRSGTECIDERCQCPFGDHQYFDQNDRKCISFANGNCSIPKISPCVPKAECINVQLRTGFTTEDGVKKIHTKSVTQCHCVKGYSENKNGYCMSAAGTDCGVKQPCNSENFLTCVDGKCKCRNPLHEMVDEKTGKCVRLVGSSCKTGEGIDCIKNSDCKNQKCNCISGYTVSTNKTCLLSYKQICEPYQCNSNSGLACINGLCECEFDSHLVWDDSAKACVGLSSSSD